MLREFKLSPERNVTKNFIKVIEQQTRLIETEYLSIAQKLVQYKKIIDTGNLLFNKVIELVKKDNVDLKDSKNITIGISSENIVNNKFLDRMLRFLVEAGLFYEDNSIRSGTQESGEVRIYKKYIPHIIFLIQNRTFSQNPGVDFGETLKNIRLKSRKQPLRRLITSILSNDQLNSLSLGLPPCQSCKATRLSTEQRFCHNCGKELINQSVFEECLKMSVDKLRLSTWLKDSIKNAGLTTVGDFMTLQEPGTELKKIRLIGPVRSEIIYNEANRVIDEFFAL